MDLNKGVVDSPRPTTEISPAPSAKASKSRLLTPASDASSVVAPRAETLAKHPKTKRVTGTGNLNVHSILEAKDGAGFVLNRRGTVLHLWVPANSASSQTRESVVGKSIAAVFGGNAMRELRLAWNRVLKNGEPENLVHMQTLGHKQKWYSSRLTPIRAATGRIQNICLFSHDITDRKLLAGRLAQAEKMEALGHFIGGISHDFNNILGVIQATSELLSTNLGGSHAQHKYVSQLLRSTKSAAALTRQLLAFSRLHVRQPKVASLNDIVTDVVQLVHRVLGEDIELSTVLDPHLFRAAFDSNEIQCLIMNLVSNAREAMPKGGTISIETGNAVLHEQRFPAVPSGISGEFAVLTVRDTGVGINSEALAHIFEPFFTTKTQGTGLGLASVHRMVTESGGFIDVSSAFGKGTCFRIYLPAARAQSTAASMPPRSTSQAARSKTVLLVEDSPELRDLLKEMLHTSGLNVIEASTAKGALRLIAQHARPVDLLITDVVMPGLNGEQLAQHLRAICPKLRVLYMTGYSSAALKARGHRIRSEQLLVKPFTRKMLLQRVKASLRGERYLVKPLPPE